MLTMQHDRMTDEIDKLIDRHGSGRGALIPILQEVQKRHHVISDFAMQTIADRLGIHPVEVYSVVSFYSFLGDQPQGRFVIRLCRTITCDMAGKSHIARQLENDLGIRFGQTTPDGKFSLCWANCLGMCDQGPAMLVNDQVFTQVTLDKVHGILEQCRRAFAGTTPTPLKEPRS